VKIGEKGYNPLQERTVHNPPFPKSLDELKAGTTVAVHHVPGYTGHIPKNMHIPEIMIQGTGSVNRTTWLKQNIVENYHKRIPGYAGHQAHSALNDRGALRNSCFSTKGESFH